MQNGVCLGWRSGRVRYRCRACLRGGLFSWNDFRRLEHRRLQAGFR